MENKHLSGTPVENKSQLKNLYKTISWSIKFLSLFLLLSAFHLRSTSYGGQVGPCSATNNLTSDGGGASIETPSGSDSDSDADTGDNALPVSSLPGPAAKVDESHIIAFAPASDGYVPVTGGADSAKAGNTVVVSTSEIETTTASNLTPPLRIRGGWGALIPALRAGTLEASVTRWVRSAHADSEAALTPLMELCDQEGIACCPANTDGSFECYVQANSSSALYIYQTTDGTDVSAAIEDTPNLNLLYLGNSPTDLSSSGTSLYAMTSSSAVKIEPTDDWVNVLGNHTNDYLNFSITSGTQFDFDEAESYFGVMNSDGVDLYQYDPNNETTTATDCKSSQTDATAYTAIKYTSDGMLRYGIEQNTNNDKAYIYYAYDGTTCDPDPATEERIKFIDTTDKEADGYTQMTHKKTLSFDVMPMLVDGLNYGIAVYEDENGDKRIRAATKESRTPKRFGGDTPITSPLSGFDFKDIQFYHAQSSSADTAKVLLLDSANNMLWNLSINTLTGSESVDYQLRPRFNGIAVGNNPVVMVQSPDRKKVYVLNRDDETISVLTTVERNGTTLRRKPTVVATVALADYAPGKTLTFSPSSLYYQDGRLFVGAENIKAAVVIDSSTITETQTE